MASTKRVLLIILSIFAGALILGVLLLAGAYGLYKATRPRPIALPSLPSSPSTGPILLKSGKKVFREGTIVRVSWWGGVYSPQNAPVASSLSIDAGRIGQVMAVTNRSPEWTFPAQVVVVKWFQQEWARFPQIWQSKRIDSFTNTINPDWIEPLN